MRAPLVAHGGIGRIQLGGAQAGDSDALLRWMSVRGLASDRAWVKVQTSRGTSGGMRYVPLLDSYRTVSVLGFGCAAMLGRVGRKDSLRALSAAFDAGHHLLRYGPRLRIRRLGRTAGRVPQEPAGLGAPQQPGDKLAGFRVVRLNAGLLQRPRVEVVALVELTASAVSRPSNTAAEVPFFASAGESFVLQHTGELG